MKKLTTVVIAMMVMGIGSNAFSTNFNSSSTYLYDGSAYIFVEGGVEFSVFKDGQFDFVYLGYAPNGSVNININMPNTNINYNSGYNYDAYVQYDDYGAIIQIEEVPIYYDEYGRIIQAGNTEIRYQNRRIVRVGGLHIYYNNYGYFSHYSGYINYWTPYYVYRPWHSYYAIPYYSSCIVYDYPYRRYYTPYRYSYNHHRNYYNKRTSVAYNNGRRNFHKPGSRVHYKDGRVASNKNYDSNRVNTYDSNDRSSRINTSSENETSRIARSNEVRSIERASTRFTSNEGNTHTDGATRGRPTNLEKSRTNQHESRERAVNTSNKSEDSKRSNKMSISSKGNSEAFTKTRSDVTSENTAASTRKTSSKRRGGI